MNALIYGHRGASAYAPENTMAAFKAAYEKNAAGIEIDIQLSKDNEVVVTHDREIDRTSDGKGSVSAYTLQELKAFDFGSWFSKDFAGERIPTLDETLAFIKESGMNINIEVKTNPYEYKELLVEKACALVEKYGLNEKTVFSSFYHKCLVDIKKINPKAETGILYSGGIINVGAYAKSIGADCVHPQYGFTDKDLALSAKENNIKINVWTVDAPLIAEEMDKLGVNSIISNTLLIPQGK